MSAVTVGVGGIASRAEQADWLRQIAKDADRHAFEHLFRHYFPLLLRYMLRAGVTHEESEELVQETMVRVWLKAQQYRPEIASPSAWIFTIARNLRIDRAKRRVMPDVLQKLAEDTERLQRGSQEACLDAWTILEHLDQLSQEQGVILRLVYLEGLSHSEISEKLSLPLGTVKSRIRLAFDKLRRSLDIQA